MSEVILPSITVENFNNTLKMAENDLKSANEEYTSFLKEHKIPIGEIITLFVIGIIPVISYLMDLNFFNLDDLNYYLLFWIISSLIILSFKLIRIQNLPRRGIIEELKELDSKLKTINEDEKAKTIFYAFGKMLFLNVKPFAIALSSIFCINIIILFYFYYFQISLNLYYFWGILLISLANFVILFISWKLIKIEKYFPYVLLNMNAVIEDFRTKIPKISKLKAILFLLIMLLILIFILFLIFGPIILIFGLIYSNWYYFINHLLQFIIIFAILFFLITLIEIFLTRASVLKWLILKKSILETNVISPSKSIILDSSSFLTNNIDNTSLIYKSIKLNYLKSMLFSITPISYYGYFTRYFLTLNFSIITNDDDFKLLTEYLEKD